MKKLQLMLLVILSVLSGAAANVIYVDCSGPNDPGSGTLEDPYRRIQEGLNAAVNGDTILIQPGTYMGAGNHDLDPQGKSIIISGTDPNDTDIISRTIIDANAQGRGFYFHSGEDSNCVVSGLTIKNAYIYGDEGAGIYCFSSEPAIVNCIFINNHAENGYGGAICCKDSNSLIKNCIINGNSAYDGGAVECWDHSNLRLINCIISNNRAIGNGGGVDSYYYCNIELTNCSLINNIAEPNGTSKGGSVSAFSSSTVTIKNSILWFNDANTGAQLYFERSIASLSYCDIQDGISDVCSIDSNIIWGNGNINTDPCFASFDANGDPNLWDFHLLSKAGRWDPGVYPSVDLTQNGFVDMRDFTVLAALWLHEGTGLPADLDNNDKVDLFDLEIMLSAYLKPQQKGMWVRDEVTSPCIDAGDPNSDWSPEPWPNGKRINMGAFGGTVQAGKNGLEADFDADGYINFNDFSYLAANWGLEQVCIEDLDGNGKVDIGDVGEFCVLWLEQD